MPTLLIFHISVYPRIKVYKVSFDRGKFFNDFLNKLLANSYSLSLPTQTGICRYEQDSCIFAPFLITFQNKSIILMKIDFFFKNFYILFVFIFVFSGDYYRCLLCRALKRYLIKCMYLSVCVNKQIFSDFSILTFFFCNIREITFFNPLSQTRY